MTDRIPSRHDNSVLMSFWAKVEVGHPLGCWWWTGATNDKGYAQATVSGRARGAHRWAYEFLVGGIGTDSETGKTLDLDHLCKNRLCVNPDHLEPITHHLNIWRSSRYAGHDVCNQGHPRTAATTGFNINGHLFCKQCADDWQRQNYDEWRRVRHKQLRAIRTWAARNGYVIKQTGRLPQVVLDAYASAHA